MTIDHNYYASLMSKASQRIAVLETELNNYKAAQSEPIAVVGMGCRVPGADNIDAFWQLLRQGVDAITEVPADRWDVDAYYDPDAEALGKTYSRAGGFLAAVDQFDAAFFGVSPREATMLDPQQRLLLEVLWETLESAAIPATALPNNTGVFIGISASDYLQYLLQQGTEAIDAYLDMGTALSTASGRLSYLLGINGPCLSVDTACSSSLTTVHLACRSLRRGDCDAAIVGGVSLILTPAYTIACTKARMLSPDSRCKTFDAAANGYVRGEGCGMVLLKRLSDAMRAGDPIVAVIRGSAINQDGRTSGLTVPNGPAQQAVIRQALADGALEPQAVGYIEAHGTGTALGDPVELGALSEVFGERTVPLYVGSVKTNLGHLEAAAGIVGLLKAVLTVQHGEIPPHLHFHQPNPRIDWDAFPVKIPTTSTPWLAQSRVAGVSSFSFSGTNAHVVLEAWQPPAQAFATSASRPYQLLTLSAKSETALARVVQRYANTVSEATHAERCYTANCGRTPFPQRFSLVSATQEEVEQALAAWLAGDVMHDTGSTPIGPISAGLAPAEAPRIAFLFTGQGAQYRNMGHELYATEPIFRAALDRCEALYQAETGESLLAVLYPETDDQSPVASLIDQTQYTQPALFAVEYALAQLWLSWGVKPAALLGHSVGEIVAACLAGVFSLEDALILIAARGRLMGALPPTGTMVALLATEAQVEAALASYRDQVAIAAVNGPESVVIAGERMSVKAVAEQLAATGVKTRTLTVSHAFHSPLMEPMLADFRQVAERITYHPPRLRLVSNVTGALAGAEVATPAYWVRHARAAVRFADGVATLREQKIDILLEIGPKPTLLGMAQTLLDFGVTFTQGAQSAVGTDSALYANSLRKRQAESVNPHFLPSLREKHSDCQQMLTSLGTLYVHGVEIDWAGFYAPFPQRKVSLPTYPFQRQRFWLEAAPQRPHARLRPLLDRMVRLPRHKETLFETEFSLANLPFLADHRVFDEILSPAACQVALLLSAAEVLAEPEQTVYRLTDLVFSAPLRLPRAGANAMPQPRTVQTIVSQSQVEVVSFTADDESPVQHAAGQLFWQKGPAAATLDFTLADVQARLPTAVALSALYASFQNIEFGPSFRWLTAVWVGEGEALAQLKPPEGITGLAKYLLHPGLLDACVQTAGATQLARTPPATTIPFTLAELICYQTRPGTAGPGSSWWCYAKQTGAQRWDIWLLDEQGHCLVELRRFEERPVSAEAVKAKTEWRTWLYQTAWQMQALPDATTLTTTDLPSPARSPWLIFTDTPTPTDFWQATGQPVILATRGQDYALVEQAGLWLATLDPRQPAQFERLLRAVPACDKLIYLWGMETPPTLTVPEAAQQATIELLHLVQAMSKIQWQTALWVVTQNSQTLAQDALAVAQTPLWGLGRTIRAEYPELGCHFLDVDRVARPELMRLLAHEFQSTTPEAEIAYHNATRYVPRLLPYPPSNEPEVSAALAGRVATPFQVRLAAYGSPDDLQFQPQKRQPPAAHEVEIEVKAAGLNFRDLLNILGMLQSYYATELGIREATALPLGFECAGIVTAVGTAVTALHVGDPVMALADGAFATFVNVPTEQVIQIPPGMSFAEAATIPMAFLTAYQGLYQCARLQAGERVLVHAAAGGVGQAAIQLAQAVGAEVFGTASPGKWAFLAAQGVQHCYHSRTTAFATEMMADTAGQGVDVVLNSLTGDMIAKSVDVLRPGGRFVEIGKLGIWSAAEVAAQRPDVQYYPFELNLPNSAHFTPVQPMFAALLALFKAGKLKPLPHKSFPIHQIGEAVRTMQQTKYTGKIVLTFTPPVLETAPPIALHADSSYLITGGLGGLGLQIAQTLAEAGAGHLVLSSRRGAVADLAQAGILDQIKGTGATVTLVQADVTQADAVARLLATCSAIAPLKGIIHAAGLLDDGVLSQQNPARFATVMQPKVHGAWYLHELSQTNALDFFIAFSSIASVVETGGQGNYAAANAFLDGLMRERQRLGWPSLSIQWGPWSGVGMAAQLALQQPGLAMIAPPQGQQIFQTLLEQVGQRRGPAGAEVGVFPIRWPAFLAEPQGTSSFYTYFQAQNARPDVSTPVATVTLREQLGALAVAERNAQLLQHLRAITAKVLGLASADQVAPTLGLMEMGMDSLMAIELRNQLSRTLALPLPATLIFDYPNLTILQRYLSEELFAPSGQQTDNGAASVGDQAPQADPALDTLTQDELAALLMQEFSAED